MKAFEKIILVDWALYIVTLSLVIICAFKFRFNLIFAVVLPYYIFYLSKPMLLVYLNRAKIIFSANWKKPYRKFLYLLIIIIPVYLLIAIFLDPNAKVLTHFHSCVTTLNLLHILIYFNSRKGNSYFLFIELMDDSLFICDKMCSQAIELNFPKDKDKVLIETEYIRLEGYPINYLKIGPDKSKNDKTSFIIPFNMIRNRDATILEDFLKSYGLTRNSDSKGDFNWFGLFKSQSPSEAS